MDPTSPVRAESAEADDRLLIVFNNRPPIRIREPIRQIRLEPLPPTYAERAFCYCESEADPGQWQAWPARGGDRNHYLGTFCDDATLAAALDGQDALPVPLLNFDDRSIVFRAIEQALEI